MGYIKHKNGDTEDIEYIAHRGNDYVRVFAKSGEYLAYTKGHCVYRHQPIFEITFGFCEPDCVSDNSLWLEAEDILCIYISSVENKSQL